MPLLPLPLGGRGIARANARLDARQRKAHFARHPTHAFERLLQVAMDIVIERLQRRDVEDVDASFELWLSPEIIEARQEGGERLA